MLNKQINYVSAGLIAVCNAAFCWTISRAASRNIRDEVEVVEILMFLRPSKFLRRGPKNFEPNFIYPGGRRTCDKVRLHDDRPSDLGDNRRTKADLNIGSK